MNVGEAKSSGLQATSGGELMSLPESGSDVSVL
jgi:hypothetical protein